MQNYRLAAAKDIPDGPKVAAGKGKRQVRKYFLSKVPAAKEMKFKNLLYMNIMSKR